MQSGALLLLAGLLALCAELALVSGIPPPDICDLPVDPGHCKAYIVRYYYNRATNRCQKFIYGGCKGNGNNFKTLEQCQKTCVDGKPGLCPKSPPYDSKLCGEACKADSDCPKDQKCCPYRCRRLCLSPI
ncbi:kunitz-type serine protease inhibitor TCI-like [Varanus komodoensis]|uniref:kunitz-type serine protease inhibitor TCI-like n=1 Tax=Varanus komodoensis TaxID=61221 RepID=UPI001CF76DB0|nr:kunitz-type serine protease inhibitor TCI-like [Varanus komodoensis]